MNKVVVNIKTDQETKEAAQTLANELGLSLSSLINVQLKQLIYHRRLVLDAPCPVMQISKKLKDYLMRSTRRLLKARGAGPFNSPGALFRDLNSQFGR